MPLKCSVPLPSLMGRSATTSTTASGLFGTQPAQQPGSAIIRKRSELAVGRIVTGKPVISTGLPCALSARGIPRSRQLRRIGSPLEFGRRIIRFVAERLYTLPEFRARGFAHLV